jgi:hypothetical protein
MLLLGCPSFDVSHHASLCDLVFRRQAFRPWLLSEASDKAVQTGTDSCGDLHHFGEKSQASHAGIPAGTHLSYSPFSLTLDR